jgi:hypothetical protein
MIPQPQIAQPSTNSAARSHIPARRRGDHPSNKSWGNVVRKMVLFGAVLTFVTAADATNLKDFWSSRAPDDPRFQSANSSLALEKCIALEVGEKVGLPNIIHGEGETIITGMTPGAFGQPVGGARIVDHGTSREVFVGALHTGGWRNKVSALVQRCI